jgi:FtsP/CotA-like multicopper oxidase with cupredoxin domain
MSKLVLSVAVFFFLLPVAGLAGAEELPIPEVLESSPSPEGGRLFELEAQYGTRSFSRGTATATLGYNGEYLGPTIAVRRGEKVTIRVRNGLREATTVHWHGAHLPAVADGGPHQPIEPGGEWEARFTIDQPAATLWYHPHLMATTARQVYHGLAGFLLIEDEQSDALSIPKAYGRNDIPLLLQERRFSRDGSFRYRPSMPDVMHGYSGDALLVNGALEPHFTVRDERVRLRLLNGGNSTILRIYFEEGHPFEQIASDGGFLEAPLGRQAVVLSPGERAEVVVTMPGPGEKLRLLAQSNLGAQYRVVELRGAPTLAPTPELPDTLTAIPEPAQLEVSRRRRFVMSTMGPGGRLTINGRQMDLTRIDERVLLESTEVWEIFNGNPGRGGMMGGMMNVPHNFHIHGLQFRILSLNGSPPPPALGGWKDTVLLWPNDHLELIVHFEDYLGTYMYHCHLLEHEDNGMMGQFEVVPSNRE